MTSIPSFPHRRITFGLAAAILLTGLAGCGRKAKPVPATALPARGTAHSPAPSLTEADIKTIFPGESAPNPTPTASPSSPQAELGDIHDTLFPSSPLSSADNVPPGSDVPFFHLKLSDDADAFSRAHAVAFSPDGKRFAAGGTITALSGFVRVFNVGDWREQGVRKADRRIGVLTFSADGELLAAGTDDDVTSHRSTVHVWENATPMERHHLDLRGRIHSLSFSTDSKLLLSGGFEGGVLIHSLVHEGANRNVNNLTPAAALSPDGRFIASGAVYRTQADKSGAGIALFDLGTFRESGFLPVIGEWKDDLVAPSIPHRPGYYPAPQFSADGKLLAAASYKDTKRGPADSVQLWSVHQKSRIAEFPFDANLDALAMTPDGKWVAAVGTGPRGQGAFTLGQMRLWDASSRNQVYAFREADWEPLAVAISPNGQQLVTVSEQYLTIWNVPKLVGMP